MPGGGVLGERARVTPSAAQVAQDGGDDVGIENERDDAHLAATSQATERVDLEDPLEKLCPSLSHGAQRRPVWRAVTGGSGDLDERAGVGEDAVLR
jgi:hypothetical protein